MVLLGGEIVLDSISLKKEFKKDFFGLGEFPAFIMVNMKLLDEFKIRRLYFIKNSELEFLFHGTPRQEGESVPTTNALLDGFRIVQFQFR